MFSLILLGLGLGFLVSSAAYLAFDRKQRNIVLDRLSFRRRRTTGSLTPPRSLSPEKQGLTPNESSKAADYGDVFPPSRRSALGELDVDALSGSGKSAKELSETEPDYSKRVPDRESLDTKSASQLFTPTGFTVEEVQRLGDFPDYATLSGVPLPSAYPGIDVMKAKPRPYRPLRWAYHQTMCKSQSHAFQGCMADQALALNKMQPDWWLELESTYIQRIQQRQELFDKYGEMVLQQLPGSEIACKELMEMCLQFYCARYPQYFHLNETKTVFHNGILKTETDLKSLSPLQILLKNVPEDFAMMLRDPETGIYSFRAGIICSSLGWNVGSKIGLKLHEIHAPIPDYKEKMQFSMDRFVSHPSLFACSG